MPRASKKGPRIGAFRPGGGVHGGIHRHTAEILVRLGYGVWRGPERGAFQFLVNTARAAWRKGVRHQVRERERGLCYWCGGTGNTLDHLYPQSLGGPTVPENCVWACGPCNQRRGDQVPADIAEIWQRLLALRGVAADD